MKVKDFIDYLSKLDQQKDIWIVYDCGYGYVCEPVILEVYDGSFLSTQAEKILKVGDYIFDIS